MAGKTIMITPIEMTLITYMLGVLFTLIFYIVFISAGLRSGKLSKERAIRLHMRGSVDAVLWFIAIFVWLFEGNTRIKRNQN